MSAQPHPVHTTPETPAAVAAALRHAADERQSLVIRGAGTKLDWGRPARHIDAMLDMRRLNRVIAHEHGDLTATIEAGASLREVNAALGRHGQWLPLDPSFADRATIGGILATNDSGPRRHRHGAPRDLVIGIQLATTDGVLSKAGGRVVKNVAGYDLSKLMTGSFGSLAAIVSATFKLAPLPSASKTLRIVAADIESPGRWVQAVMASQLEPVAFEVLAQQVAGAFHSCSLLLRFASLAAVVDAQVAQARELIGGDGSAEATSMDVLDGEAEQALWRDCGDRLWNAPGAIVRASWLPADITPLLAEVGRMAATRRDVPSPRMELIGRAGVGAGLIRIDADVTTQARVIEQLRQSTRAGHIVILRGSADLKTMVDVWGPPGDRGRLLASLKQALDPTGVLNAGRGPL